MKRRAIFGCIALLPAALNAPLATASSRSVAICSPGGTARTIEIPLRNPLPGSEQSPCCAKGCHSGQSRKRSGQKSARG